jgi:glycosyltransferase involved in cell wall biosynthesis
MPPDVRLFPVTIRSPQHLSEMHRLFRFLRNERVAILHSHLFFASLFASPVGVAARVPVILETPHIKESWRHGWKASHRIDRAVSLCVDRYIAVSHSNAEYLAGVKGFARHKIQVIQNGSDLTAFDPGHKAPAGLRGSLGFGDSDPVMLLPARLEPQKGHSVLLEAMALLKSAIPNLRLVCAGEGVLRAKLEAQIEELQLQEHVRLVGYQNDLRDWLAMADIGVLPSFFEGLPLVAIECLAAGRPMVATAVDGTPEVVVDGKTGLTVPAGDARALAAAIERMLRDHDLRQRCAKAGREWVEQRFTLERQVRQTEALYSSLLGQQTAVRTFRREQAGAGELRP